MSVEEQVMTPDIVVDSHQFVRVTLHGALNATDRIEVRKEIAHVCNANSIYKILVDHRDVVIIAWMLDHYEFGKSFNKAGFFENPRISVIINKQIESSELLKFSCLVAYNRGTMVETFNTEKEALDALGIN
ncbi:MAG: hypothetical protein KZQ90_20645 [Candidatus Thiodiazotropha sp. (ex Codakia rugifera)]|nr:hypothetical protein [Candidatus Thiodiazotropha sp. (ex Codakia rugifera)]